MNTEKSVAYLLDRLAIEDQIRLYAELIDRKRFDELELVFTPDAWIDYTASGGMAGSLPEIREYLRRSMGPLRTQHMMGNVRCEIDGSGESAETTVMLFNPLGCDTRRGPYTFFVGLWYHDRWVRTKDGWRMTRRVQEAGWEFKPQP